MHGGEIMTRVFSVGIGVVIGAILVKPDILLWIPALNSPNVDTNVGVITILLAIWSIVRDSMRERERIRAQARERELLAPRHHNIQMRRMVSASMDELLPIDTWLRGAVVVMALWFFVRLWVA
jgi:hypothetical protein